MHEETLSVLQERAVPVGPTLRGVFDRSYRRLVVQMYGIVGDIHEAEDLVQEAFVRATAAGNRFPRVDNHEAWLRTTAVNLHRNRWRKLHNLAKIRHRLEQPTDLAGLDEHVAVVVALRTLPEAHRQVIALHYLADLPVAEVAETLGCAVGTVKSRLQRARESLALALGSWDGTPMPDLFLKDFRERAESLVPVPDLLKLQRRGTAMRRVRLAASAAVLAFAVAIGGTLVAVTSDDEQAISPAPIDPAPPRSADACDAPVNDGDPYVSVPPGCELGVQADEWAYVEPGPYFVRPFNNSLAPPGDLEVWFVVPGGGPWYWWGGGVGMAGPVGPEMKPYIRIGIIPITGVQEQRCQGAAPERVQTLPGGVLSVAQTLVASPRIKVLEAPHSVQKFGRDAARVRFTVTQSCPGDRVFALWRALGSDIYAPLGERLTWPGAPTDHVLDLWVVDVPGEQHVAVVADYTVDPPLISGDPAAFRGGARASDLAELQELLDSIRFEFTE